MRQFLAVVVLLVIGIAVLGYYRNWFTFKTTDSEKSTNINVTVDKEKVKADEEKAKAKLQEIGGQIKDEAGKLSGKSKKEGGTTASDSSPPQ